MTEVDLNMLNDKPSHTVVLQPGDKVIFEFDQRLDQKLAERISEQIRAKMGDDFPFLVIGEGIDVSVYRETA